MNAMKKYMLRTACLAAFCACTACDAFLDVLPEDQMIKEQIETSEASINTTLNGLYTNLGKQELYGEYLTKSVIDVLALLYDTGSSQHSWSLYSSHRYAEATVLEKFDAIWAAQYRQILEINEFIDILDHAKVAIPENRRNILRGEALGLRAFHHFDVLRLFGPVYNSPDSTGLYMTYNSKAGAEQQPLIPANEVVDKILADLAQAETLLANDPIIANGIVREKTENLIANFYINRHCRMNYYAVKAMQARVHLWRGNKPAALAAAKTVIAAQSGNRFQWITPAALNALDNPDLSLATEAIFGFEDNNLYTVQEGLFGPTKYYLERLNMRTDRATGEGGFFESNDDYRRLYQWPSGGSFPLFAKFKRPGEISEAPFAYYQPMIRIAEMYYIAAECDPSVINGIGYLIGKVRPNRGLAQQISAASAAELNAHLQKEYIREFFGEGQAFYYYKRMNLAKIPDGTTTRETRNMDKAQYVLPMPVAEREGR